MIDERQEELASLYVLGLLEGSERRAFVDAMRDSDELRVLVASLHETAAGYAYAGSPDAEPPRELKSKILASLPIRATPGRPAPMMAARWVPWALAAGFATLAFALANLHLGTRAELARVRDERTVAELEAQTLRNQLEAGAILSAREQELARNAASTAARRLAESERRITQLESRLRGEGNLARLKIAALTSLLGDSPEATAIAVWDPENQDGLLRVSHLPPLADDQDYQLWVIDPQYPIPVDGGVFRVAPETGDARVHFHPDKHVATALKFAVSRERRGGVPKAEGPLVLVGE